MIHDRLDRFPLYAPEGSRLAQAFEYLANVEPFSVPDGRVDVDGDNVFALHQQYDTRAQADCRFEAHRKYLDIQFVFEGAESMGWADVDELAVADEYDITKDVGFFEWPETISVATVRAGEFTVFNPGDAHAPGMQTGNIAHVRKIVMKVLVNESPSED